MAKRNKPAAARVPVTDRPPEPEATNRHVAVVMTPRGSPMQVHNIIGATFFVELAIYAYTLSFIWLCQTVRFGDGVLMKMLVVYAALCLLGASLHHTYLHFSPTPKLFSVLKGLFFFMAAYTALIVVYIVVGYKLVYGLEANF